MEHIVAVIVSYNPETNLFDNVKALTKMVQRVIVVDNGSLNEESIKTLKKIDENITKAKVIYNSKNLGIATALNIGCENAISDGATWVLTLDDDSKVTEQMVQGLIEKYNDLNNKKILLMAPLIKEQDKDRKVKDHGYVNSVITSGSLYKAEVFNKVGWFKDEYFIDMVDVEYCFRLKEHGFKIFLDKDTQLIHRLGRSQSFLKIGRKEWSAMNHNEIRKYYIFRNTVQMYKLYFSKYPIALMKSTKGVAKIVLDTIVIEKQKKIKLKMITKGIIDGIKNRMGSLDNNEISR
jgi:rhamnosyltransferase